MSPARLMRIKDGIVGVAESGGVCTALGLGTGVSLEVAEVVTGEVDVLVVVGMAVMLVVAVAVVVGESVGITGPHMPVETLVAVAVFVAVSGGVALGAGVVVAVGVLVGLLVAEGVAVGELVEVALGVAELVGVPDGPAGEGLAVLVGDVVAVGDGPVSSTKIVPVGLLTVGLLRLSMWYGWVPVVVNVVVAVSSELMANAMKLPSSEVIMWEIPSWLCHSTTVPTLIVAMSGAGPELVMVMTWIWGRGTEKVDEATDRVGDAGDGSKPEDRKAATNSEASTNQGAGGKRMGVSPLYMDREQRRHIYLSMAVNPCA